MDKSISLFTSVRERSLWLWTLIVVMVIYSTLGLARTLAWALRDQGLLTPLFLLGVLLIAATIVTQALRVRPGGAEIAAILGIAAAYLLVFVRMGLVTERSHLIEYGIVAVFIYEALRERASQGRRVPVPALLAIVATTLIGVLDEGIQLFLPSRVFDPIDILFNFLAAVMAVGASVVLTWVRRRVQRQRQIVLGGTENRIKFRGK
ncbi:VanZ family protein [bacterium]|nr:VanZ family protein [bacterium]